MMFRQKFSVYYLACCYDRWAGEGSFFFTSVPAWVQTIWESICLVSPSVPAAITVLQAAGNDMFASMSQLTRSLMASSDWPPRAWHRGSSARRRALAASTALLRLLESPTRPSPPSAGDPGNTRRMNVSAALASLDLMTTERNTHQDMTSSLLLPFEAVPDLTHCHITLFLKTNKHMRTLVDISVKVKCDEAAGFKVNAKVNKTRRDGGRSHLSQPQNLSVIHVELRWHWLDQVGTTDGDHPEAVPHHLQFLDGSH